MLATSVPHTISDAALERIKDSGFGQILTEILEHAEQSLPGLERVEISGDEYDRLEYRVIYVDGIVKKAGVDEKRELEDAWRTWAYAMFRPELAMHFLFSVRSERYDEV